MKNLLRVLAVLSSLGLMVVFVTYKSSQPGEPVMPSTNVVAAPTPAESRANVTATPAAVDFSSGWKPKAEESPLPPLSREAIIGSSKSGRVVDTSDLVISSSKSGVIVEPEDVVISGSKSGPIVEPKDVEGLSPPPDIVISSSKSGEIVGPDEIPKTVISSSKSMIIVDKDELKPRLSPTPTPTPSSTP